MYLVLAVCFLQFFLALFLFFKMGYKSLIVLLPVLLFSFFLVKEVEGFGIVLAFFTVGFLSGICFNKLKSMQFFLLTSSFIVALIFGGDFAWTAKHNNFDATTYVMDFIKSSSSELKTVEEKQSFEKIAKSSFDFAKKILPFNIYWVALIFSVFSFSFARLLMQLVYKEKMKIKRLEYFALSDYVVFVLIAALAALVIVKTDNYIRVGAINVLLIVALLYFIQALGIIKFFLMKKGFPIFVLPLVFVLIALLSLPAVTFAIFLLSAYGVLDLWVDFRKLKLANVSKDGSQNE